MGGGRSHRHHQQEGDDNMKLHSVSNILLLFAIFIYQLFGNHNSQLWGNFFYVSLYGYLFVINLNMYRYSITKLNSLVIISAMIYFGFSLVTEILCIIWPSLYSVYISKTHLLLSGVLLILMLFILLTLKIIHHDT
jgi:hypothetical protein